MRADVAPFRESTPARPDGVDVEPAIPAKQPQPAPPDSQWRPRWAGRRCIVAGAATAFLGTFLPWAGGVYRGHRFGWNGWGLYFLDAPHVRAAVLPMVLAVSAAALAWIGVRRPSLTRLAGVPGSLIAGFVLFTYRTYAGGPFGAMIRSQPGYSSKWLGVGFWMMLVGGLLVMAAGVAADRSPPQIVGLRLTAWLSVGFLEFGLLHTSPAFVVSVSSIAAVALISVALLSWALRPVVAPARRGISSIPVRPDVTRLGRTERRDGVQAQAKATASLWHRFRTRVKYNAAAGILLVAFAAAGFILFPPEHTCPPGFRLDRSVSPYRCLEMAGLHRSLPVKVDWPEGLFLMVGLGVVAGLVVLILGVVEAPLWGPLGLGRHRE